MCMFGFGSFCLAGAPIGADLPPWLAQAVSPSAVPPPSLRPPVSGLLAQPVLMLAFFTQSFVSCVLCLLFRSPSAPLLGGCPNHSWII